MVGNGQTISYTNSDLIRRAVDLARDIAFNDPAGVQRAE
jgi:hypothetical protein